MSAKLPLSDEDDPTELVGGDPEVGLDESPLVDPLVVALAVVEVAGSPVVAPPVVLVPEGALQATVDTSSNASRGTNHV